MPTFDTEKHITDKVIGSERDQRIELEKTRELINRKFNRVDDLFLSGKSRPRARWDERKDNSEQIFIK